VKRLNNYKIGALVALFLAALAAIAVQTFMVRAPMDRMGTVLITGSNSGIGLRFARQYAAKGWTVIATHRRDTIPETLKTLAVQYENVRIEKMNVRRHDEIDALAAKLRDTPIDLLINNAGISYTGDGPVAQTFGTLNYDLFDLFMSTNALGPVKIVESFLPHVAASDHKKIVNISSSAGRVTRSQPNSNGMWYRVSKTALNGLMVSIVPSAKEFGIMIVMFEPGSVRFDVQKEIRPGQIEAAESVAAMIETIERLTLEDTGKFLTRDGNTQPW
jgi:NAD(P)-dependent dehydrogenase (short-subunit alcohol dehydrogenase family)